MLEGRDWHANEGASLEELAKLQESAPAGLPSRYLDLLTFGNGGEGSFGSQPLPLSVRPSDGGRRNDPRREPRSR